MAFVGEARPFADAVMILRGRAWSVLVPCQFWGQLVWGECHYMCTEDTVHDSHWRWVFCCDMRNVLQLGAHILRPDPENKCMSLQTLVPGVICPRRMWQWQWLCIDSTKCITNWLWTVCFWTVLQLLCCALTWISTRVNKGHYMKHQFLFVPSWHLHRGRLHRNIKEI